MANGAFKFKDNSGNVVAHISGSGTGIMVSGSALGLTGSVDVVGSLSVNGSPIISNYSQLTSSLDTRYVLSGSITQTTWDNIASKPSGIVSGSSQIANLGYAITGSNTFQGSQTINGNLIVTGSLTAQQFIVSSSVTYMTTSFASGSTKFGDDVFDNHNFTGSVFVTGSLRIPTASSTANIAGTAAGQLFFNTTDNNIYRYNGSSWLAAAGSSGTSGTSGTSGSSGSSGVAGSSGTSGTSGTSGSSGSSGNTGSSGTSGLSGANGSSGTSGTSGANGTSGSSGVSGTSGSSGNTGTSGTSGTSGAATINSNTDNYVLTATGTAGLIQGESNLTFDGSTLGVTGAETVSGKFTQGGGASRSTSGTTISLTVNSGFTANSDITDGNRFFSIVNNSSTANTYVALSFRINPNAGTNNAMFDLRYANGSASNNSSTLYWTFNDGGTFYDRMTLTSAGAVSATSFAGGGSGLTSLPTNTALYPTLNQNTTGNAASATNATASSYISVTGGQSGAVTINEGRTAVYRTEGGSGGTFSYAPVLHVGGGDTMWQIQGSYGGSGTGNIQWRQGYQGAFGGWCTILHSANYTSYSPSLTGSNASGTWGINVTGNAGTATTLASNATVSRDLYISGGAGGSFGNRLLIGGTSAPYTFEDTNVRPVIYTTGAYPVITLNHTQNSNGSHGPTIQFTHNTADKQWVIGTNGTGTQMDFGYSTNTSRNPHNGIDNYQGNTYLRISNSGNITTWANLIPATSATYTLGASSNRWGTIYTNDLSLKNEYGDYTIVEGEENLYLYNNKSGKVFTFNLTEVDPTTAPPKKYLD
jgi:hypothetical protein